LNCIQNATGLLINSLVLEHETNQLCRYLLIKTRHQFLTTEKG